MYLFRKPYGDFRSNNDEGEAGEDIEIRGKGKLKVRSKSFVRSVANFGYCIS